MSWASQWLQKCETSSFPVSCSSAPEGEGGPIQTSSVVLHGYHRRLVCAVHQVPLLLLPLGQVNIRSIRGPGFWGASQFSTQAKTVLSGVGAEPGVISVQFLPRHAWLCTYWMHMAARMLILNFRSVSSTAGGLFCFNNIFQCFQTSMVFILCSRSLNFISVWSRDI